MFLMEVYKSMLKSSGLSTRTRTIYYKKVLEFYNYHNGDINNLEKSAIDFYISLKRENPAQQIITTAAIKKYYDLCTERDNIKLTPFKRQETLPEILTTDELKRFFNAFTNSEIKLFVEMLYYLGLRRSEAFNLSIDDLLDNAVIIRKSKSFDRVVGVSANFFNKLKTKADQSRAAGQKRIFNLEEDFVRYVFKTTLLAAGITKKASFHTLRHSCATNNLLATGNIDSVQNLLGHKNIKTTKIYAKFYGSAITAEIN